MVMRPESLPAPVAPVPSGATAEREAFFRRQYLMIAFRALLSQASLLINRCKVTAPITFILFALALHGTGMHLVAIRISTS